MSKPIYKKKRYIIPITFVGLVFIAIIYFRYTVILVPPEINEASSLKLKRKVIGDDCFKLNESWLKKNEYGLWEMFVAGNDFELGVKNGILAKELIDYQEEAFVEQIREMIPSDVYLNFLKYFIAWLNKDLVKYIPISYQKEIYGVSLHANNKYNFIAPNYHRILNYHAAHDIGHTLQNMNLVACTAFGVTNTRSIDSSLLVGRNMDFYSGDKFAENKIVAFVKPEKGYSFASITWGGLIGVISGMNSKGLTVTLNAAETDIPTQTKTPVSILAREILQHAATISQAYEIAKKHETFVAESFLIASAIDNEIAVIEKSPENIALYKRNDDELILTNHFQSDTFLQTTLNKKSREEGCSVYRWETTEELLDKNKKHTPETFAAILRNQKGKNGIDIGMGNEKAINQLIAHHSVIFKPKQLQMWVSTSPFQLGEYLMYDLNKIFSDSLNFKNQVYESNYTIAADSFKYSTEFQKFVQYKEYSVLINKAIDEENLNSIRNDFIAKYEKLNPRNYYTYVVLGDYYNALNNTARAVENYSLALKLEVPRLSEVEEIRSKIDAIQNK